MRSLWLPSLLACALFLAGCGAAAGLRPESPGVTQGYRIAVLPVDNLSGSGQGVARELRASLMAHLADEGVELLGDDALEQFMTRHRLRYVGGVDQPTSQALMEETGSNAVLVTNLETYQDVDPPRIALYCRLVSTGPKPQIIWMDGISLTGDQSPGVLDLGLVHDHRELRDMVLGRLVGSLVEQLSRGGGPPDKGAPRKFRPRIYFDASYLSSAKRYSIGVLPFINLSERNNAGELVALQAVRQLASRTQFDVLEPGLIREKLLSSRIIMNEGISKLDLDILSNSLGTDLMLAGKVNQYQDANAAAAVPRVEFSTLLLEGMGKKIVWSSTSYNQGDDTVYFFEVGRAYTAQETTERMMRAMLGRMKWGEEAPEEAPSPDEIRIEKFRAPSQ